MGHWLWRNPDMAVCSNCGYVKKIDISYPFRLDAICPECKTEMVADQNLILESDFSKDSKE